MESLISNEGVGAVARAIHSLSSAKDIGDVMQVVRSVARKIAGADGATFIMKEGNFCYYADEEALTPLWKGQRFPIESCVSGWSMLTGAPVTIKDVLTDERVPRDIYEKTFVKSLVIVPIRARNPLGAIGVYWSRRIEPGTATLEALEALAEAVSFTIENLREREKQQTEIDRLAQEGRAKDEFLMAVSHELRTPLNAILGWSELLAEGAVPSEDLPDVYKTLWRNARAQTRVVGDLLDTSKIILEQLEITSHPLDLIPLVKSAVDSLRPVAAEKDIRLDWSCELGSAPVMGDEERLHQVFCNLLTNAIKFSRSGGEIRLSLERKAKGFQLQVCDQGVGIDPTVLPHIFERFRSGEKTLARGQGGLGLGLTIVKYLVEAHEGEVTAQSDGPGKGTTITVSLPPYDIASREDRFARPSGSGLTTDYGHQWRQ